MHHIHLRRRLFVGLLLVAVSCLVGARQATAQDVFLPPEHQLRRQLEDARQAIDEERYNDAVKLLGFLIAGNNVDAVADPAEAAEDYFIEPPTEGSAQRSLKAEARRLLASLPKEGRQAYQLLYGHEAELLLERALTGGDIEGLTEIVRKYFHTAAGYRAAMLLGRYHLYQGRPLAAALVLKQMADLDVAPEHDPELSLLLATSWHLAEMPDRATASLVAFKQRHGRATVRIGGREVSLFQQDSEALDWLRRTLGDVQPLDGALEEQWLVFRGNAARNAPTQGGTPMQHVRWAIPTPNDLKHQQVVAGQQKQFVKQRLPAMPSLHPLVVRHQDHETDEFRDIVLTRTPNRLIAVDFQTGERVWFFPPWSQNVAAGEATSFAAPPSKSESPQVLKLKQRTWQDTLYGQLSTDGEHVFFVDELGLADSSVQGVIVVRGGIRRANRDKENDFNQLIALELAREGYTKWSVGGAGGGDEPKLAGAFFLGPPLPLMGRLYVLAEMKGDVRLVVLDPATGQLHWQQQLCGVDNQAILDDRLRRLSGAVPSFADGVLICPTSAGAVVAVDVAKRSLLWGFQYMDPPKEPRHRGGFWPTTRSSREKKNPGEVWNDASVTIAGDKVLITPVEHDELICLSLLEGTIKDKPLWKRERGDGLYIAGVHQGKVVVVGQTQLLALQLDDGSLAWRAQIPDAPATMPSGRGFQSGDHYYLPLTSSELVKIDLRGGKLVQVIQTNGTLGNLVCYADSVISQGATEVQAFYQLDALSRIVDRRLQEDPDDPWALARHAELVLRDGERKEALESLRKAHTILRAKQQEDPENEQIQGDLISTQSLLVEVLLEALKTDFAANQKLAKEVDGLIDRPDQRAVYLRRMALGLQEIGQPRQAFEFYLKIIDEARAQIDSAIRLDPAGEMQQVEPGLQVRRERWLMGQLARLMATAGEEDRAAMNAAIQKRLAQVMQDGSIAALRDFNSFFGNQPVAHQARLALAGRLWNAGELLEAELLLSSLMESDRQAAAAAATAQMARLLKDAGHVEESAAMYRRLRDEFADVDCGQGKTGADVLADLPAETAVAKAVAGSPAWPTGRVEVKNEGPSLGYSSYQRVHPADIRQRRGPLPDGVRMMLDRQRRVSLHDGLGRRDVSVQVNGSQTSRYYTSNYSVAHAKLTGHFVVLALGYEVFAIDMLRSSSNSGQRVLWRKSLANATAARSRSARHAVAKSKGHPWGGHEYVALDSDDRPIASFAAASHWGVCLRRWEQIICVDPLRPDVIHWVRDGIAQGAELIGDEQVLLVVDHGKSRATVLSTLDGRKLGECEVGPAAQRMATLGRRIVQWDSTGDAVQVQAVDPWDAAKGQPREQPVVWSHTFSPGSKAALIEQDEVAVMQPDGKLRLIDLADGQVRFTTQLEAEPKLEALHVLRGEDEYIVAAHTPIDEGLNVQAAPGGFGALGQHSPLVVGRVYAIDREMGKSLWPVPAVIDHYGLPLDQSPRSPVLLLMRNISPEKEGRSRSWKTEVLCLDKRDGRVVFHKSDVPGQTQVYRLLADADNKTVALMLPGQSFTMRLTDHPRPPEPPAQTGAESSLSALDVDTAVGERAVATNIDVDR